MKSAIDFLVETLAENGILHSSDIEQAKEMFEKQIIKAFKTGECDGTFETINAEQYYNETFNSKE
jgi:hypothetical protein